MKRNCPGCNANALPVSELILSDTVCPGCDEVVGVQSALKAIFFVVTFIATVSLGFAVLVSQGIYAALLIISLPIGAIGFIKARYCPLVVRKSRHGVRVVRN